MNPPPPVDPTLSQHAASTIEVWAKVAGSLGIVWAFLEKVGKPYYAWRKQRYAAIVRDVLRDELDRLDDICEREEAIQAEQQRILERQSAIFSDLDTLIDIATDNRDRLDEMNELLDFLGLASRDRRQDDDDRRQRLDGLLDVVTERRKQRRRHDDPAYPNES